MCSKHVRTLTCGVFQTHTWSSPTYVTKHVSVAAVSNRKFDTSSALYVTRMANILNLRNQPTTIWHQVLVLMCPFNVGNIISCFCGFASYTCHFINPRRACAARVTVIGLCIHSKSAASHIEITKERYQRIHRNTGTILNFADFP